MNFEDAFIARFQLLILHEMSRKNISFEMLDKKLHKDAGYSKSVLDGDPRKIDITLREIARFCLATNSEITAMVRQ